jgi:HCOMODA/2-hydroxy-3-carboxy-muconic semialdehyde decarboxylase
MMPFEENPMFSNQRVARRDFVRTTLGALAVAPSARTGYAQQNTSRLTETVELKRVVAANRILAHEDVVDAFGHVSIRDPENPKRYIMARSRSPELVEFADLIRFEQDGRSLDPENRTPYGERMIHGAIYEARSDVNAVVHNHAYSLLPFGITGKQLRPVVHVASVIGYEIPLWDIMTRFNETDQLVRTMEQGRDLAKTLGRNTCVLMRGHGAAVAAETLKQAVIAAIYLKVDAEVQMQAMGMGTPKGLTAGEVEKSRAAQFSPLALDRAWEYFCVRAGVDPA